MIYYCDSVRWHLICIPYSIENLHRMARDLDIHRCHFHKKKRLSHYDIPRLRIAEIRRKCVVVSNEREIVRLIKSIAPMQ